MSDLIRREAAITIPVMPKEHRQYQTMNIDDAYERGWYDLQDCIESLPSAESKTDGVFIQGGLTISGEPPMPEGCMDCKLQDRCLCIPPDLSADEISELYISRRPNCPLSMVAEPKTGAEIVPKEESDMYIAGYRDGHDDATKTGKWIQKDMYADRFCSCCDYAVWDSEAEEYNYCPNCGAMMLGEDGEA